MTLASIQHVVLDMDGTIYRGDTLFPQTPAFLENLDRLGVGYTFLTNNCSHRVSEYVTRLRGIGVPASADRLYTSFHATLAYLRSICAKAQRLFVLGTDSLKAEFAEAGYAVVETDDPQPPDVVVVSFDRQLTYERLCRGAYWIDREVPYVSTHPDMVCPTDQPTVLVDCGAIQACLVAATGRQPQAVLGKPEPYILEQIAAEHDVPMHRVAMVGDRLNTDIAMAGNAGAMSVLVLTGEGTRAQAAGAPWQPDLIVEDLEVLAQKFSSAQQPGAAAS